MNHPKYWETKKCNETRNTLVIINPSNNSLGNSPLQQATLVLLFNGDPPTKVLLGFKKFGFGQGKYTGFGGKVEPGESILDTAVRELAEETGINLRAESLQHVAVLEFIFPNKP